LSADDTAERIKAELEDIEIAVQDAQDAWGNIKTLMTDIILTAQY
jgi:hypothetical protein